MRVASSALMLAAILLPIVSQKIYESGHSDLHDIGALSEPPLRNQSQIIWTLDRNFIFYIPYESSSATVSFYVHAPYGGFARETKVKFSLGNDQRVIVVQKSQFVSFTLRNGQSLNINVEECVVPSEIEPGSPDNRSLCLGLSKINVEGPPILLRYWEMLWG